MRRSLIAGIAIAAHLCTVDTLHAQAIQYREVKISDRVFAFLPNELGAGNAVVILGDDGVIVVDATLAPSTAAQVLEAVRRRTDLPIRTLILTHWHDDHIWGAQVFNESYDGLNILSHRATRDAIVESAIPGIQSNIAGLRRRIDERAELLRKGQENGQPLSAERRAALEQRQLAFREMLEQLEEVEPTLPTLIVSDSATIYSGEFEVRVLHAGRGHTAGDLVVYVPSESLLVTGDLLTVPFPAAAEAFIREWPATLARLAELDAVVIVPGHGEIQRGDEYLLRFRALLQVVLDQTLDLYRGGASADEAAAAVDVAELKRQFVGDDAAAARAFDRFFLLPAVTAIYKALESTDSAG